MAYWFEALRERADQSYKEQFAFLSEEHGFSRAHANALVMYCRGSESSRRFDTPDAYFASVNPVGAATLRAMFDAVIEARPELELVVAWNQPMLKRGTEYVFGASVLSKHILLGPWGEALQRVRPMLDGYKVNVKTVQVAIDRPIDTTLVLAMVDARLAELS